ncbi:hypothetical protein Gorai_000327, partial [Gossypium raimondii]|nr:hypothetical protein [Gossypium raimondii]
MVDNNGGRPNTGIRRVTKKVKRRPESSQEADDPTVDGDGQQIQNQDTTRISYTATLMGDVHEAVQHIRMEEGFELQDGDVVMKWWTEFHCHSSEGCIGTKGPQPGKENESLGIVGVSSGDRMAKMMTKGANGVRKMGPNRKGKGVLIGHRPKVGPKILKPINSNGETSGLNQKKFDDGSSMAHDK